MSDYSEEKSNRLSPEIFAAFMYIESCGNPIAESYGGAEGLFQLMPIYHE